MKKYYITNDWDVKSYLCYEKNMRPNHYWSSLPLKGEYEKRVKYNFLTLHLQLFLIWLLARDINTSYEEVEESGR